MELFDKTKLILFEILKTWQKKAINKGVSEYYDNFEENSKKQLEIELEDYKSAIKSLAEREKTLKKEIKKNKEKKKTLKEVKNKLNSRKDELEKTKKEISSLPKRLKQIKSDFNQKFKDFLKEVQEIYKFKDQKLRTKEIDSLFSDCDKLIDLMIEVNEIVRLTEIIKRSGMEFKLETSWGTKKVKKFRRVLILMLESLGGYALDAGFRDILTSDKIEWFKKAKDYFTEIKQLSRSERFNHDVYQEWHAFATACYVLQIGIQEMETHDYFKATQHFLKARELFSGIKKDLGIGELPAEEAAIARAYASDSFNLLSLLNSQANWRIIAKNTKRKELKEIAEISSKNIEEWITKQYGFPSETKIKTLIGKMIWPTPELPAEASLVASTSKERKKLLEKYKE